MLSYDDFNESLIHIALLSEGKLNEQLFKSRWQNASSVAGRPNPIRGIEWFGPELLEALFTWIDMPDDAAEALKKLKFGIQSPHPNQKKKV